MPNAKWAGVLQLLVAAAQAIRTTADPKKDIQMNPDEALRSGKPFDELPIVPTGFIEVVCTGSGMAMHIRVDSIAGYGPEQRLPSHLGEFYTTPIQLRGQPRGEATEVRHRLREIAQMCVAADSEVKMSK